MRTTWLLAPLLLCASARADPPSETPAVPIFTANTDPIDDAAQRPLAERGLVLDTALTVPAGEVDISGRTIVGLGQMIDATIGLGGTTELVIGVGDSPENTMGASKPILTANALWIEPSNLATTIQTLGLKQVLAHGARWQLSADGTVWRFTTAITNVATPAMPLSTDSTNATFVVALGAIATACVDRRCRILASLGGRSLVGGDVAGHGSAWLGSASLVVGGEHVRGVVEMIVSPNSSDGTIDSMLFLGARVGGQRLALEVGVAVGTDDQDTGVAPMIGVAARL